MASFDFKKYLPHLIILAAFIAIAAIWGWPGLTGKVVIQGDIMHWQGMIQEAKSFHEKTGQNTLWSNSMFGGMPTYTYYVPESSNLVGSMQQVLQFLAKPAYFPFIAMLCFYILMLVLRINKWLGAVGAIGFAFATFNVILITAGHETELLSIAYMPAVLAGAIMAYRGSYWGGAAITALSLSLMAANQHYQVMYYEMIILGCMVICMLITAIKEDRLKEFFIGSAVLILAAIPAVLTSGAGVLATKEYTKATMRGGTSEVTFIKHDKNKKGGLDRDYAFGWSNGWGESFCVLVPDLYGGASGEDVGTGSHLYTKLTELGVPDEQAENITKQAPTYWGPQQFISGPVYFGAVICFLFLLGIFAVRSPHKWWLVIASAIGFMLSVGKHFPALNYFLFDHAPLYNNFRTPTMALVIPQVLFPVLGIWGIHDIITDKWTKAEVWRKVMIAAIVTAGLCLVLGVGGKMFFNYRSEYTQTVPDGKGGNQTVNSDDMTAQRFSQAFRNEDAGKQVVNAVREDRSSMATTSGLKSALFVLLAAALLWAFSKGLVKKEIVFAGLAVLILADLLPVAHRYLNEESYADSQEDYNARFFPKRQVDDQILKDTDPYYRVLDLSVDPFNDAAQAYWHKCIGGYSPTKMETYQDMIDVHMRNGFNHEVLNMLNTKYIITPGQGGQPGVFPNAAANGNAWFVSNIHWAPSADSEILFLTAPPIGDTAVAAAGSFNSKETAVIRDTFKNQLGNFVPMKDSAASIKLDQYGLNDISFTSSNSKDGLGVFADIYYNKGWKAYIDEKEVPIIKANYILRALKIPAGNHKIRFSFRPVSWEKGNKISLFASILVILICLTGLVFAFRKPKNNTASIKQS